MNSKLRKIVLLGIPLLAIFIYFIFIFYRIDMEESKAMTENVVVALNNPQYKFVNKKEILKIVNEQLDKTENVKIDSINKYKLEKSIKNNPFIEEAEVFITANNSCRVEITQRSPVLRVLTNSESYYLDKEGYKMPTGPKYAAHVHLYRGHINEAFARKELLPLQEYIDNHSFWSEMIDYIMVNSKEELTLYLKAKSGIILFGKPENVDLKLKKLLLFIDKVGKHNGLEDYESIDLRFNNQVVVKNKKNAT